MLETLTQCATTILIGLACYWLGPLIINWLMTHIFVTHYQRTLHKKDLEKRQRTLGGMFTNVWRIIVVVIALYFILQAVIGKEQAFTLLAPLFASAGIIGVALGFGAQSLVKDFISGIFIISENQYRVGDVIEIEGFGGTVERIGVRSTVIRDVDGNVHFFPNGMVQHIINKTMGYSMARFTLAVAPDTDIDKVAKIIDKIGLKLASEEKWKDKVLEAPRYVMMGEFTATAINLIVSGKTQPSDQWSVTAEMRRRILEKFDQEGIEIGTIPVIPTTPKKK
ncbi:mechanosensitive ion channel family protein [Candidatus Saccharibacteria bacterium]|jgi:mscS mechanosensitive ion channel|nr:mechanosensitive ion channel family protein [Candidatus Saccharibacteria bacterium]QCT40203.1 mechanosensitive ion channel family protein [Candidatus Saccharibacteria bacterium oral taxon 955]QHU89822.1 mechanosensitive ion channel [Candidatus Saccharibacteria bacterium oral taxon 955]QHU91625.1 mechanosensitive ion channel [Candidatus Saccharibacteria bacterium oral taxon 955]QJU06205.1 mechanosensitive ion channel family protein [Candidatus Saccharibacteria bacterium oral taxon 955]